jgi:hypothetical protein
VKRPNFLIFMTDHQRGDTVLPEHPARAKEDLCRRMWGLARDVGDAAPSGYITVGLAPYGPAGASR